MGRKATVQIGDKFETNNFGMCKITKYVSNVKVQVKFDDNTKVWSSLGSIRQGQVKNPNKPIIYGVGYVGLGNYSHKTHKLLYDTWHNMIRRCYDEKAKQLQPAYTDCYVHTKWLSFQNFAYDVENMVGYDLLNSYGQLDKDIKKRHNKKYSKNLCCIVPKELNTLLIRNESRRGIYPIGVLKLDNRKKPFIAQCRIKNENQHLGYFYSPEEAFAAYKSAKEQEIKRLAKKYKHFLDNETYSALMSYNVYITD